MKQLLLALTVGLAIMTESAFGCSCVPPRPRMTDSEVIQARLQQATSVFVGTVITNERAGFIISNTFKKLALMILGSFSEDPDYSEGAFNHIATFRVQTNIKNAADTEIRVTTGHFGSGLCGFMFEVGKSYLVYAYGENQLETNICWRSKELERYSTKDYAKLREQLQAPFLTFPSAVEVLPTMDDAMNFYRNQRNALEEQNYARSQFLKSRITGLAADRALVNRTYRRFRKDGTIFWKRP